MQPVTYNEMTFVNVEEIASMTHEEWVSRSADYWVGKKGRDEDLKRVWELSIEQLNRDGAS